MILIRGIKGEEYARKIENGIVDCRDILSALLQPPVTGYEYSDYYEKNLVRALTYFSKEGVKDLQDPRFLYSVLIDPYIPHIYLTYFHVLNERSLEWLDKFEEDYQFIAVNVKIDKITKAAIGNGYFGTRMSYVDSIREIKQDGTSSFYAACMCSLENLHPDKSKLAISLQIYNTLSFSLLCREVDDKFSDIENEFRIIAYDCPIVQEHGWMQLPREAIISGKTGAKYKGVLEAETNSIFKSNLSVLTTPDKLLMDLLIEENGMITIDSQFKPINIRDISDDYKYLGGKEECAEYIKEMLKHKPKDIYVNRTVRRKHKLSDISDAVFVPGFQRVEY